MGNVKGVNVEKPSTKLDNVNVKSGKLINNIINDSSQHEYTTIRPYDDYVPKETYIDITAVLEGMAEIIHVNGEKEACKLLQENGINYNEDDIKSVKSEGSSNERLIITTNSGEEFVFTSSSEGYVLSSIKLSDGTKINCDLSESREKSIRDGGYISEGIPIRGYATIDINGQKFDVNWVGDDVDFETFKNNLNNIKEGLKEYPSNVLKYIKNNSNFKGFYVGTFDSLDDYDRTADASTIAFAYRNEYIYVNVDHPSSLTTDTIVHEMTHILNWSIGKGNIRFTDFDIPINLLFLIYKQMIQQILLTGYPPEGYPDGVPDSSEFFSQAVAAYVEYPEELEALMPELYVYIDFVLNNL